jgi:hypothetical protein
VSGAFRSAGQCPARADHLDQQRLRERELLPRRLRLRRIPGRALPDGRGRKGMPRALGAAHRRNIDAVASSSASVVVRQRIGRATRVEHGPTKTSPRLRAPARRRIGTLVRLAEAIPAGQNQYGTKTSCRGRYEYQLIMHAASGGAQCPSVSACDACACAGPRSRAQSVPGVTTIRHGARAVAGDVVGLRRGRTSRDDHCHRRAAGERTEVSWDGRMARANV